MKCLIQYMKNPSFCWNHNYTSTELHVTYIIVWSSDTDNDTKLGQCFAEGESTNIKSSLKNNAWVF